ncbi:hypothetical protein EID31_11025 [Enterococcus faecalis]|nr:hypothetical protein [Enterococcus faecalis]MUO21293.1 hypothetical protein [Enterococcus faecalis]
MTNSYISVAIQMKKNVLHYKKGNGGLVNGIKI